MRRLQVVVRTASGTLPLVVAASVSALAGCGKSERHDETGANTGAGSGGASAGGSSAGGVSQGGTAGSAPGTGGIIVITGGSPATGGSDTGGTGSRCMTDPNCYTMTIPLPSEGTPVAPGELCAATVEPVESNRTALVTLEPSGASITMVTGFVTVAPEVSVLGIPTIEVLDATNPYFRDFQMSPLEPSPGGNSFTFQGSFPEPLPVNASEGYERMTLRVTLEAACDGGSRQVHAVTDVHLCLIEDQPAWASSGQSCCVCRIIAEMAPSPIVPEKHADELPLANALRLRIVELARVSNTIVLLAENDGGEGLEYEWLPSAGTIERLADDVIAWTLEEGTPDPFVQAAVFGKSSAAVASFAFNDRAA